MEAAAAHGPYQPRPERLLPDEFWLYTFKVVMCPLKHTHDWEKCIYAHPNEKARRRHPSKYQAVQCPEARAKKPCPRGEECPYTHHLFELWLHPSRYLTCLCELGAACNRPICFFAHHPAEVRPLPDGVSHGSPTGSRTRRALAAAAAQQQQQASAATAAAGVSRSSSPSPSLGLAAPAGPRPAAEQAAVPGRQLSSSSLNSTCSAAGSGNLPAPGSIELGSASDGSSSRPGFAALDSLSGSPCPTPAAAGQGRGTAAPAPRSGGVVVLDGPHLEHQQAVLQQAVQHLQMAQLTAGAACSTWEASSGAVPALAPITASASSLSLTSSASGLSPTGAAFTAAMQQQQQLLAGAAATSPAGGSCYSPCVSSLGAVSNSSLPPLVYVAGQAAGDGGLISSAFEVLTPVSTPGGTSAAGQHAAAGQMAAGSGFAVMSSLAPAAQLAALQAALEEPEQLSFSLWDANGLAAAAPQHLAAGSPQRFSGFGGAHQAAGASHAAHMQGFAAAPANTLVYGQEQLQVLAAQQQLSALTVTTSEAMVAAGTGGGGGASALSARCALLRQWVGAASAAGPYEAAGGAMGALAAGGACLTATTLQCMARDLYIALSPADVAGLAQQLQLQLQLNDQLRL